MAYTATISSKTITSGVLKVTVTFTNSEIGDSFNYDITTTQNQSDSWLEKEIQSKLNHLNALPTALNNIEIGSTITQTNTTSANSITPYEEYKADLKTFQQMVNAIQKGIITKDNTDFIALKAKLTANFSIDYIDLF